MKTVLFFRHGKSDWDADYGHDHERPLTKRGRRAARRMGRFLAAVGPLPDAIASSTAVRAVRTVELARAAGGWPATVRATRALYEAGPRGVLDVLAAEPDETRTLLVVGHEPTWSETVGGLVGGADLRFPTAAMARVDLDVERWADAAYGTGRLVWLVPPKLLEPWVK